MKILSHTDQKLFLPFSGKCLTEKLRSCILSISPLRLKHRNKKGDCRMTMNELTRDMLYETIPAVCLWNSFQ